MGTIYWYDHGSSTLSYILFLCVYVCVCVCLVTKDIPAGQSNFHIWDMQGQLVTEYIQKKQEDW